MLQDQLPKVLRPVSTPREDHIHGLIIANYNYIQSQQLRWRPTPYRKLFDETYRAALRDPALRRQNPFQPPPSPVQPQDQHPTKVWFAWVILAFYVVGSVVFCIALRLVAKMLRRVLPSPAGGTSVPPPWAHSRPLQPSMQFETADPIERRCGTCSGSGQVLCSLCNGSGGRYEYPQTEHGVAQWLPCNHCTCSGRLTCPSCNGRCSSSY
jgi:hypothetical protein